MSRFVSGRTMRPGTDLIEGIANTGATATGEIISTGTPAAATDLITKGYVDALVLTLPLPGNTVTCAWQAAGDSGAQCNGTFTVPTGVSNIFVQVWGAGGGGGMNCSWKVASPGGGGGYAHKSIAVSAGQIFCYCAGHGGQGGCYPSSKVGQTGCHSVFWGPTSGPSHCVIGCGGCGGSCNGNIYGGRVGCGGCSQGGDLCVQGGDAMQNSCCASCVSKCNNTNCYTPQIFAGGSFLGAPTRYLYICYQLCCPGGKLGCHGCGMPFGGGGFGGISGGYSGGCACGSPGGGGAVVVWF